MSAYVLTVARGGAKLTSNDPIKNPVQQLTFSGAISETMYGFGRNVTLREFMNEIQRVALDRPIVDRTGISGTFDINFEFTREGPNSLGMTELPQNAAPNLITALDQQLGLKIQVAKAPVDVIVIDHAEKPSDN